ncbi:hypothetical protein ABID21_001853 [Pseudorhizobium tarimense]|uniref:Uncharacterized protein n=1 Tax=Pseudorhizobium tarimense TaxID=1079109 RepID=A0ABV2H5Q6_9HYPH|nr:hypothetical protein [Pseudorhizobium tarimense]MCJ8518951.1 hypothetical protein [Pseudorhizobium tarimense]
MRQRTVRWILCGILLWSVSSPAGAQNAIAFSQAPEMSSGVCVGGSIREALACAKRRCIDGGGTQEDCLETTACFPAGWSVDLFVPRREGPHWHEVHCGFDSREGELAAADAVCDRTRRTDLIGMQRRSATG